MYGNGASVMTGGIGGAGLLASTGSGGILLPLAIALLGLTIGALLVARGSWIRRNTAQA
jgi:hypothetical protein